MNWSAIPHELRILPQWCIAGPDKRPYHPQGYGADSTDPRTWSTFDEACRVALAWQETSQAPIHIGFMLSADNPFTCIDLDVKPDTDEQTVARFHAIISTFDSFTERSASGRGFHIWVRAVVGAGARRDGVEVYDRERFMICTGDVLLSAPVEDRQELITMMVQDMRSAADSAMKIALTELDPVESNDVVMERATTATNSDKFNALWIGDWASQNYPSQSEADLSLLSMLCFYTASNSQVRELFRMSGLGKREKAVKNNAYLNRTLINIRSRQAREAASDDLAARNAQNLVNQYLRKKAAESVQPVVIPIVPRQVEQPFKPEILSGAPNPNTIPWPPGLIGEIAQWMHSFAPRPVREVAIVSALGFFAGIAGRAYNVSNSGLNLYLVLVGRSGVGKEALHSGISKLVHTMLMVEPAASGFIDFADYASGPALVKSLSNRSSFCNVAGEWGRKLKKMADDSNEGPMQSLRTAMTNLYQKSSAGTIVGGIGYSDKEKDIKAVNGVAYSMIGESTPETFYESLTNTMMQDGFMSRFIIMEYTGLRPALNTNPATPLRPELVNHIQGLMRNSAAAALTTGYPVIVQSDALAMLDEFNLLCDRNINATNDESKRQMWNRAHLKALKVSALLAVADNPAMPHVNTVHATWALDLVNRDIQIMDKKMNSGDVGDGDMVRERKLISVIKDYLVTPLKAGYGIPDSMRLSGVVARKFLQVRVQRVNSFLKHRNGYIQALDASIRSLVDSGYLVEMPKDKIQIEYGAVGKCYRIAALPEDY